MDKKLLILIIIMSITLIYSSGIMAERTTSVGLRVLTQLEEEAELFYGPVGRLDITENFRIRGSYLFGEESFAGRIGVEGLYLYDMGLFTSYIGGGINQVSIVNFSDFVAGIEMSVISDVIVFLEGIPVVYQEGFEYR